MKMDVPEKHPEEFDENSCIHQEKVYPEATQVCGHELCMICKKGEWVEASEWPEGSEA